MHQSLRIRKMAESITKPASCQIEITCSSYHLLTTIEIPVFPVLFKTGASSRTPTAVHAAMDCMMIVIIKRLPFGSSDPKRPISLSRSFECSDATIDSEMILKTSLSAISWIPPCTFEAYIQRQADGDFAT